MFELTSEPLTPQFVACWRAAGEHIHRQVQGGLRSWLNATLGSPSPEQFSFRLGNQLFFVRLEVGDWRWDVPGTLEGVLEMAERCNGHACLMPMAHMAGEWRAIYPDWGLVDATTHRPLNPIHLVNDELIEMTDWELHDFAVEVARSQLEERGLQVSACQAHPEIEPAIWIEGEGGAEWVTVRAVRYPGAAIEYATDLDTLARRLAEKGTPTGRRVSVTILNADQSFDRGAPALPLYRGHGMQAQVLGLDVPQARRRQVAARGVS